MTEPIPLDADTAPFSHELRLGDLPRNRPFQFDITPSGEELERIARLFDAVSVKKMRFSGSVEMLNAKTVLVTGQVGATVVQPCVVTLGPVKTRVDSQIERRLIKAEMVDAADHQILPEEDENLDLLSDPIDLGAIAVEAVALELPPYPRAEGAELDQATFAEPGITPLEDADLKPFKALEALKDKMTRP